MALNTGVFVDGQATTVEKAYELKIDLGDGLEFLCNKGLTESFNFESTSWKELCAEGGTSTLNTGYDYTIAIDAVVKKSELTDKLAKKAHSYEQLSGVPVQLDNTFLDQRVNFSGNISVSDIGGGEGELVNITGEIKTADGIVIVTDGIPEETEVTGELLNVTDILADSASVIYSVSNGNADLVLYSVVDTTETEVIRELGVSGVDVFDFTGLVASTDYIVKLVDGTNILDTITFSTTA